jgi:YggT family protein
MGALITFIRVYEIIVLIAVVSSWFPSKNILFQFVRELTDPILNQIRKILPSTGGFDFSPMILWLGLSLLRRFLGG